MFKILFAAAVLRLINLNQSLWLDEAISFIAVKNYNFLEIITKFSPGDVHPPLYYLILKLWTALFGYSEIALRFPSVIFGVLTVFLVYKIGGKKAAFFMAINPLAIYYSQEARMYSLETLLVTGAVYFFLAKKKFWFLLFLISAFYTDYLSLFMIPVLLPLSLVSLPFLLPWLPVLWSQFQLSLQLAFEVPLWGQVVGGFSFKSLILVPIKFIFGRIPSHLIMAGGVIPYLALLRAKNKLFWTWLLVPIFLGFLISIKVPVFTYHRFLFVLPAFLLLLASGAGKKATVFIVAIGLISLAIFNLNLQYQREDWRGATVYINSDPGKVVMPSLAQSAPLTYYGAKMNANDTPVYLIRYVAEIFDPQDSQRTLLEKAGYKNIEQKNFNGVIIWKYVL